MYFPKQKSLFGGREERTPLIQVYCFQVCWSFGLNSKNAFCFDTLLTGYESEMKNRSGEMNQTKK